MPIKTASISLPAFVQQLLSTACPLSMIEDEQILLQNLSNYQPSPICQSPTPTQQLLLDVHQEYPQQKNVITEKQKQRRYFVDWDSRENHDYFTRNVEEEGEGREEEDGREREGKEGHGKNEKDYSELTYKLEIALHRIKLNNQAKETAEKGKRSMSIQPRKERENFLFSRTGKDFRDNSANHRKKSINGRVKTEAEEESWTGHMNPPKTQKYQIGHIITEEREKESLKENALKNKFLVSMALWQQKKEKRIQQRIEKERKLSMEGVTFTPQINAKSREIMKRKGVIAPIYQRECREKKRELTERFNMDHRANRVKY